MFAKSTSFLTLFNDSCAGHTDVPPRNQKRHLVTGFNMYLLQGIQAMTVTNTIKTSYKTPSSGNFIQLLTNQIISKRGDKVNTMGWRGRLDEVRTFCIRSAQLLNAHYTAGENFNTV